MSRPVEKAVHETLAEAAQVKRESGLLEKLATRRFAPELSFRLQRIVTKPHEWLPFIQDVRRTSEFERWEAGRASFVTSAREPAAQAASRPELRADPTRPTADRATWLRASVALRGHASAVDSKYADPAWQGLLERAPDASAAGGWLMLRLWVLLDLSIDSGINDHRLASSCDDMNYAYLASYTRLLWTRDEKLRQRTTQVFPDVSVGEVPAR